MKADFISLFNDNGIKFIKGCNNWINFNCIFCNDKNNHGGINLSSGYYSCFKCGGSSLKKVISTLLKIEFYEVEKVLEQYQGRISIKQKDKEKKNASKVILPIEELNERARKYLIKRNFDPDYLYEKYKISGISLEGEWAGRIIIPVFYNNRLVSYQGRSILSKRACKEYDILRYKTLKKELSVIDAKDILFNLDNCLEKYVVVNEGPFDTIRWGDNACATLGTSTTDKQKILLAERFEKGFIIFDPEKEAQARAKKLAKELSGLGMKDVQVIDTELKHDIGASTDKEIKELKRSLGL